MDAITLTFGDCMENHVGMQKVGEISDHGFNLQDFKIIKNYFKKLGANVKIYHLNKLLDEDLKSSTDDAYFMIIENGVNFLNINNDDSNNDNNDDRECLSKLLYIEHSNLEYDKKYYDTRRNKVLNKLARWNLCFDDIGQEADYINKKGTIVAYNEVPYTFFLKNKLESIIENNNLKLEANYYYDIKKTGIGFHGDSERRKVIGVRLGKNNKIVFKWFLNSQHIGKIFKKTLHDGDIYIMSEKAVGTDWKKRNILTLRHAAGSAKYTN